MTLGEGQPIYSPAAHRKPPENTRNSAPMENSGKLWNERHAGKEILRGHGKSATDWTKHANPTAAKLTATETAPPWTERKHRKKR